MSYRGATVIDSINRLSIMASLASTENLDLLLSLILGPNSSEASSSLVLLIDVALMAKEARQNWGQSSRALV